VVYERATRGEDRFFLDIAEEVIGEMDEQEGWRKERRDQTNHAGGRPYEFEFRPMLIVLMLVVYHRKEYREMSVRLRNDPALLRELGLKRAPSKSIIHSAASRIGLDTLADVNDAIVARFKKILEDIERDK
jgi:hypothetical protein